MRKIRVAIFVMQLNRVGGGGYDIIKNWISLINKKVFNVHFIVVSINPNMILKDCKDINNIKITLIDVTKLSWYSNIQIFQKLYKYFKNNKIDVVHTVLSQADILGGLAAKFAGVPVLISSVIGYLVNPQPRGSIILKKMIYKFGYDLIKNNFDKVLAISKATSNELEREFNVPDSKLEVNYCGIKLNRNHFNMDKFNKSDKLIVGVIGELIPDKGVGVFVDSIPSILEKYASTRFIIAGDGPEMPVLVERMKELGIYDKVNFLGWVTDGRKVIEEMDIFVFPSLPSYDGLPRVILEAWAVGTPVLATKVACVPELIRHNIDGIVVNPNEPQEIANGVLDLLSNRDKAARIAKNAFGKVKDFDVKKEIATMERIYIELLEQKSLVSGFHKS